MAFPTSDGSPKVYELAYIFVKVIVDSHIVDTVHWIVDVVLKQGQEPNPSGLPECSFQYVYK